MGRGAGDRADSGHLVRGDTAYPEMQSQCRHAPARAVVDGRADGATLWTGSQKPNFASAATRRFLL
jgi:hypothetical protein